MQEILIDSVRDCLKLLPFLYLSYLAVEYAEHRMSEKTKNMIYRAGKAGPILGAFVGVIPQCGFAAASAGLFAGGMITPGTLLAVFLSTSDEMLPIMLSEGMEVSVIARILLVKILVAIAAGLLFDFLMEKVFRRTNVPKEHPDMCEHDGCGCGEHGIWRSALSHTVRTAAFLFVISLAIGICMEVFGVRGISHSMFAVRGIEEILAGLVGMIPNCAASVLITQLFLEGILGSGALFSGLLCGAGTGLLVLYRENTSRRMNLALTAALYVSGVAAGFVIGRFGIL